MNDLQIGDIVKNDVQTSVVRWMGTIGGRSLIGLESRTGSLPGYTNGICTIDHGRYFDCPDGRGYYILRSSLGSCYRIVQRTDDDHDENFRSAESSPEIRSQPPMPRISMNKSPSRGILSRLTSDSDQRNSSSSANASRSTRTSETYRPDNYRSRTFNSVNASPEIRDGNRWSETSPSSSQSAMAPYSDEYYLDRWTFNEIESFLGNEIDLKHRFCLLIGVDDSDSQTLVEDQMNNSASFILTTVPKDIRIELTRIFQDVKYFYPSGTIRLRGNKYLLLAIICSRSKCAYIRTRAGWVMIHDGNENNRGRVIREISDMIDGNTTHSRHQSEVCCHVLRNASDLYYKLID